MRKFLLVLSNEYQRHVLRWRFLFSLFSLPFFMVVMVVAMIISLLPELNFLPVGYVDLSGLLYDPQTLPPADENGIIELLPFRSEDEAAQALQARQIQAYYVLEADYRQTSRARLVSRKRPSSFVSKRFEDFVRDRLLSEQPEPIAARLSLPNRLQMRALIGSSRQLTLEDLPGLLAPALASLLLMLVTFSSSSYLLQAITEERANRTLEILITCTSPMQLIGGKTLGLIAVNLTQVLFWVSPLLLPLLFNARRLSALANLNLSAASLALILASSLLAFTIQAALMVAIGAAIGAHRESQALAGLLGLPIYIPLFTFPQIIDSPHSPLAIGLSYFPLTAPIALNLRAAVTTVPWQQTALSLGTLLVCALAALWLAGASWRLGMLQTGSGYGLRGLLRLIWRRSKAEQAI
ncbi:MAG: ABC transporter permease [Chloroflexota bacterium]